ncbi:hypothetical protein HMPREF1986_01407 [Oribacterium sp. oral taxon 078 str. F0263]|nr:hypothetical protein HMPREF1986_01407 [Oribacterium sp. oral taxon 078 str. F0263]
MLFGGLYGSLRKENPGERRAKAPPAQLSEGLTSAGKLLDFPLSEEAGFPLTKDCGTFSAL